MTKDNHMLVVYIIISIETLLILLSTFTEWPFYVGILPLSGWAMVTLYWKGYETAYRVKSKHSDM